MRRAWVVMAVLASLRLEATAHAEPAEIARHAHLGVAVCASSMCHGKIAPQEGRNVGLSEYRTWTHEDRHSRAYRVLEETRARSIAAKLGLGKPTEERACLDCHADNVPKDRRGPRFQLSDGVTCEACHGGAEKWIENHAVLGRRHEENVAEGMYPSERPLERGRLCLRCHLGSSEQFANHTMMAAGHPRLSFELETYSTNQPAHYIVDADYRQRKGAIAGVNMWLTGQLESAQVMLALAQSDRFQPGGMFPELALYDCHSCHHPMDQPRWSPRRVGAGTPPGTLRLQTQNLVVLQAALRSVEPPAAEQLATLTDALVKAGQRDVAAVTSAAGAVRAWLKARDGLSRRTFSREEVREVRRTLLGYAADDRVGDYVVAEQIVLGVESLSYSIGDRSARRSALDRLYATVKSGTSFNPAQFASTAKSVQGEF